MTPEALREWMAANRYSVRALARLLGVAPSTVQRWRYGERAIPRYLGLALKSARTDVTVTPRD